MKKKVNDVKDMVVSVEFNPIEIGFIQASIDTYLENAREIREDKDGVINLPLIEPVGKICLGKFNKAVDELEKNYEWGKIND
ncbi:MAG: hypothetical protein E7I76_03645 [Anaerococcus vaginalis]|uniref:hypothetical protein n=1 Tax=Anaerococcus vaginalis TaxID=33037 RepID=UPI00290B981E|nr:hypothetical protein [Anaerococcus vaginalis]MDU7432683.1 hypothetical protein [Anaerococcus vaginalis]